MSPSDNPDPEANRYSEAAHQRVMARITSGRVDLSTLQTLCLLTLKEFNTNCAHLYHEPVSPYDEREIEEQRRCYWSITLLRRLLGESAGSPLLSPPRSRVPPFPASTTCPPATALTEEGQHAAESQPLEEQNGILFVVVTLS
ncbi:hypothetical protein BJX76DRAFT_357342 [Aspergillus varians]